MKETDPLPKKQYCPNCMMDREVMIEFGIIVCRHCRSTIIAFESTDPAQGKLL